MTTKELMDRLKANVGKLSPGDQKFAYSLLSWRSLSPKQMHWVEVLGERAIAADKPAEPAIAVGDVSPIIDMLERANKHLKFPLIAMQGDGYAIRVSIAGARARIPGSITITSAERLDDGKRAWYGRITRDGGYEPSQKMVAEDVTNIADMLRTFAADPAAEASRYGRLHGRCCFCRLPLKDERSTAVGYGHTCADHYGLPWGEARLSLVA